MLHRGEQFWKPNQRVVLGRVARPRWRNAWRGLGVELGRAGLEDRKDLGGGG